MKIRIFTLALLISGLTSLLHAQIAMGKWRTHFAYNIVNQITQSENKVFAVSEGALFSVDKEDQGIEFYSKLSGLSDSNISGIEYDAENKQLLIVYLNGNIDFLSSGGVVNIPDLYNKQMSSSKAVNHIAFYNGKAYLSCGFGTEHFITLKFFFLFNISRASSVYEGAITISKNILDKFSAVTASISLFIATIPPNIDIGSQSCAF